MRSTSMPSLIYRRRCNGQTEVAGTKISSDDKNGVKKDGTEQPLIMHVPPVQYAACLQQLECSSPAGDVCPLKASPRFSALSRRCASGGVSYVFHFCAVPLGRLLSLPLYLILLWLFVCGAYLFFYAAPLSFLLLSLAALPFCFAAGHALAGNGRGAMGRAPPGGDGRHPRGPSAGEESRVLSPRSRRQGKVRKGDRGPAYVVVVGVVVGVPSLSKIVCSNFTHKS